MAAMRSRELVTHAHLRSIRRDDLDWVLAIEQAAYRFPWRIGHFEDCLKAGYRTRALMLEGQLIGYSIVLFAPDEAHLLNICVSPRWQSRGLGEQLLQDVVSASIDAGSSAIFLEARTSNTQALGLYKKHGFKMVGRRKHYYKDLHGREHADVMRKKL